VPIEFIDAFWLNQWILLFDVWFKVSWWCGYLPSL